MTINVSNNVSSVLQPLTSYHMLRENVKFMCALFLPFSCCSTKCERLRRTQTSEKEEVGTTVKTHLQKSLQIFYLMVELCENLHPASWGFYVGGFGFFFKYFWLIFCNAQLKLNSQKTETIYISPLTRWEGQSFHIYKFYLIHSLLWVLSGSLLCLSCFAVVRSNSTSTRILHILPVCFETVIPTLSVPFGLPDFQEVSHWKNLKISG